MPWGLCQVPRALGTHCQSHDALGPMPAPVTLGSPPTSPMMPWGHAHQAQLGPPHDLLPQCPGACANFWALPECTRGPTPSCSHDASGLMFNLKEGCPPNALP